jgi:drug/metabolite transporter (DMT)-like permease
LPRLQILCAAALFSTGGVFIKLTDLDAWQVAGGRSLVAALLFALLLRAPRRAFDWRSGAAGCAYAATMLGFVVANKLTTAANSIFLQSTAPLYVLFLAPLLLGESRRRHDGPICLLIAAGLVLFFVGRDPAFATAPNPTLGNAVAAVDGVFWALTLLSIRWLGADRERLAAALIAGNLIAALVAAPFAVTAPTVAGFADLLIVLYLGVFQIAVAYLFMTVGMRRVATLEASILLLTEPVLSAMLAWLVHGELAGPWSMAGSLLVVTATAAKSIGDVTSTPLAR